MDIAVSAIGYSSESSDSESSGSDDDTGEADPKIKYETSKLFEQVEDEDMSASIAELDQMQGAIGNDLSRMWRIAKNSEETTDVSSFLAIQEENNDLKAFISEVIARVQTIKRFDISNLYWIGEEEKRETFWQAWNTVLQTAKSMFKDQDANLQKLLNYRDNYKDVDPEAAENASYSRGYEKDGFVSSGYKASKKRKVSENTASAAASMKQASVDRNNLKYKERAQKSTLKKRYMNKHALTLFVKEGDTFDKGEEGKITVTNSHDKEHTFPFVRTTNSAVVFEFNATYGPRLNGFTEDLITSLRLQAKAKKIDGHSINFYVSSLAKPEETDYGGGAGGAGGRKRKADFWKTAETQSKLYKSKELLFWANDNTKVLLDNFIKEKRHLNKQQTEMYDEARKIVRDAHKEIKRAIRRQFRIQKKKADKYVAKFAKQYVISESDESDEEVLIASSSSDGSGSSSESDEDNDKDTNEDIITQFISGTGVGGRRAAQLKPRAKAAAKPRAKAAAKPRAKAAAKAVAKPRAKAAAKPRAKAAAKPRAKAAAKVAVKPRAKAAAKAAAKPRAKAAAKPRAKAAAKPRAKAAAKPRAKRNMVKKKAQANVEASVQASVEASVEANVEATSEALGIENLRF